MEVQGYVNRSVNENRNNNQYPSSLKASKEMLCYIELLKLVGNLDLSSRENLQKKIMDFADVLGIDLGESLQSAGMKDALKKSLIDSLAKDGLLVRDDTDTAHTYVINQDRVQDYYDLMYRGQMDNKYLKTIRDGIIVSKKIWDFCLKTCRTFNSFFDSVKNEGIILACSQGEEDVARFLGKLPKEKLADLLEEMPEGTISPELAEDIRRKTNGFIDNGFLEAVERNRDIHEAIEEVTGIPEAGDDGMYDVLRDFANATHIEQDKVENRRADRVINKFLSTMMTIYDIYSDVDKEIRGDSKITKEMVSDSAKKESSLSRLAVFFNLINNFGIDFAGTIHFNLRNKLTQIEQGLLKRGSRRNDQTSRQDGQTEQQNNLLKLIGLSVKILNTGLGGLDKAYEGKGHKMLDAMFGIMKKNARDTVPISRAYNFATYITKLNMFRAGNSKHFKGWFRAMHMRRIDSIYAMAVMELGMKATVDGVVFKPPKMIDVERIADRYQGLSEERLQSEYLRIVSQFQEKHAQLVREVGRMRTEQSLEPLSRYDHYNSILDNSEGKSDDYKIFDCDYERFGTPDIDVEKIYGEDNYKAIIAHKEDKLVGYFNDEKLVVMASLTREGHAAEMQGWDGHCYQMHNNTVNECKNISNFTLYDNLAYNKVVGLPNEIPAKNTLIRLYYHGFQITKKESGDFEISDHDGRHMFTISKDTDFTQERSCPEIEQFVSSRREEAGLELMHYKFDGNIDEFYNLMNSYRTHEGSIFSKQDLEKIQKFQEYMLETRGWQADKILDNNTYLDMRHKYLEDSGGLMNLDDVRNINQNIRETEMMSLIDPLLSKLKIIDPSFKREGDVLLGTFKGKDIEILSDSTINCDNYEIQYDFLSECKRVEAITYLDQMKTGSYSYNQMNCNIEHLSIEELREEEREEEEPIESQIEPDELWIEPEEEEEL